MAFTLCACGGIARGKSAYEIAVDNGFIGTEKEWLESLKGTNGQNGLDGSDGVNFNPNYTASTLYEEMVALNLFSGTFEEFVREYFSGGVVGIDSVSAINKALRSTVSIYCPFVNETGETVFGAGAGVFYSIDKEKGDAIIITNFHVTYIKENINNIAQEIYAVPYGSTTGSQFMLECTYVGGSATYDLAVLSVKNSNAIKNNDFIAAATITDSTTVSVGETVYAVGNPEADGISASQGILSVDSEYVEMRDVYNNEVQMRSIRFDATVSPGNSGGGLYNGKGELIGIVHAKSIAENVEGIGYAIPSRIVSQVVTQILDQCYNKSQITFYKPVIGITVEESNSKGVYNEANGKVKIEAQINVSKIETNSIAKGVLVVGDRILAVLHNGVSIDVCRNFHIVDTVLGAALGDVLEFVVVRNGNQMTVSVTITESCLTLVK